MAIVTNWRYSLILAKDKLSRAVSLPILFDHWPRGNFHTDQWQAVFTSVWASLLFATDQVDRLSLASHFSLTFLFVLPFLFTTWGFHPAGSSIHPAALCSYRAMSAACTVTTPPSFPLTLPPPRWPIQQLPLSPRCYYTLRVAHYRYSLAMRSPV